MKPEQTVLTIHPNSRTIINGILLENHGREPYDIKTSTYKKLRNHLLRGSVELPEHITMIRL